MKTEHILTNNWVVAGAAGISCLLWGSAFPCIKTGYTLFHITSDKTSDQVLFAGIRFVLAGILVLLFYQAGRLITSRNSTSSSTGNTSQKSEPDNHIFPHHLASWKRFFLLSLFQTIGQYFLFYIGMAHTSGVKASIIEGTNVFVAILVASLLFHFESLSFRKVMGCILGFAGVVIINLSGSGLDSSFHWNGEGFIFLSTFAYAVSSVVMKHYSSVENPVRMSGWQFILGGLVLSIGGLLTGGRISLTHPAQAYILLYLAFISAGAYTLWGLLLKYNPVSKVSVYGFMNPVFGVILSYCLLHESGQSLGIRSIIALILVCAGIYIVNIYHKQEVTTYEH